MTAQKTQELEKIETIIYNGQRKLGMKNAGIGTLSYQNILIHIGTSNNINDVSKMKYVKIRKLEKEKFLEKRYLLNFHNENDQFSIIIQSLPFLDKDKKYYFPIGENNFIIVNYGSRGKWYYSNTNVLDRDMYDIDFFYIISAI